MTRALGGPPARVATIGAGGVPEEEPAPQPGAAGGLGRRSDASLSSLASAELHDSSDLLLSSSEAALLSAGSASPSGLSWRRRGAGLLGPRAQGGGVKVSGGSSARGMAARAPSGSTTLESHRHPLDLAGFKGHDEALHLTAFERGGLVLRCDIFAEDSLVPLARAFMSEDEAQRLFSALDVRNVGYFTCEDVQRYGLPDARGFYDRFTHYNNRVNFNDFKAKLAQVRPETVVAMATMYAVKGRRALRVGFCMANMCLQRLAVG